MNKQLIGIIGCGIIADTHVEAIKEAMPGADICVCDPLPGKAELLRKKYGLKSSYNAIGKMLSVENPFSVHVLSPPQFHVEHTSQCLESGCHVLVEKPLAFNSSDVDMLYDTARKNNKALCVDHSLFYQPSIQKMFEKMQSDAENDVLYVNCFYGLDVEGATPALAPEGHWKLGLPGGAIIDSIIHPVTLAVEMTEGPRDMKINFSGPRVNPQEVCISWQGQKAMASIIVSSQAKPFRRVTEVTTRKQTFVIDHSTESLVSLTAGFGPKSLRKLLRNFGYGTQLILGTIGTVINVLRGKLKENPGARGLIKSYYKQLMEGSSPPISEENVRNSTYALEKIVEVLTPPKPEESAGEKISEEDVGQSVQKKTTLVTGASGFLGNNICKVLCEKKHRVIAQVRRGPNSDKLQFLSLEKIFEDFNYEPVNYERLLKEANEVIHCAHGAGAKTWEQVKRANVDATIALYEAAAKAGCKKFIFISSVAVYGVHQKKRFTVNEETPASLGNSRWDFYIRSKTMAEKELLDRASKGGPKLLIIRPGILYSADGIRLARRSLPLKNSRLLITFGNGKNHSPYTRVDILAEAICETLDRDSFPEGIYNMAGNPEEDSRDFIYNRMKKLGVTCRFLTLPALPFRLMASVLEFIHTVTLRKSPPKITRYIIDSSTRDIHYDCSKAEKELGWNSQKAIEI